MSTHLQKAVETSTKLVAMAEDALVSLDMAISSWPGEFRAIMWETVATIASNRAADAKSSQRAGRT